MSAGERLAGAPALVAFAGVLGGLLVLVFPTNEEYAALTAQSKTDAYSLAYLETLTRAHAGGHDLRLVYAKQLSDVGRWDEAIAALAPLEGDPRARHLDLDVRLARARTLPEASPERLAADRDVRERLSPLAAAETKSDRLRDLAALALELDDPACAARAFERLADMPGADRVTMLAAAARWSRASGDGARAVRLYGQAAEAARDTDHSVEYAMLAAQSLEAEGRPLDAAELAARWVERFPRSSRLVALAARLATAANRASAARSLGRRLLALAPHDERAQRDQVDRELAAGDPRSALVHLRVLVARNPNDPDLRLLEARVAEWSGDLDTAERDLIWLVGHRPRRAKR